MPSPYVKSLSKETGKPESEIEKLWSKAKDITSDTFDKKEKDFDDKEYSYTIGIVKNMLGIKEELLDPSEFLNSDLSAREFIETVTSSSFPSLDKNLIPPDEDEDEEELEITKEEKIKVESISDDKWGHLLDKILGVE